VQLGEFKEDLFSLEGKNMIASILKGVVIKDIVALLCLTSVNLIDINPN
jgi:hypothetical protein